MSNAHTWTRAKAQSSHWSNLICEGSEIIATVNGTGYPTGIGWSPVCEQRAQLIAAAPDLLAALHKVQDWLEGCSTRQTMQAQVARAIALATGEETDA